MAYTTGAFALGLALTLLLAAWLTPRRWWRRANLGALAILAFGTWAIGSLLLSARPIGPASASAPSIAMANAADSEAAAPAATSPAAGRSYHVFDRLNLRAAGGTGTQRVAVVPPGTLVTATGARDGDWWEVSASVKGRRITGWVSSLWLRRAGELPGPAYAARK